MSKLSKKEVESRLQAHMEFWVSGINNAHRKLHSELGSAYPAQCSGRAAYCAEERAERERLERDDRAKDKKPLLNAEETSMVMRGNRIDAARAYHERTGVSKKEALTIVNSWDKGRK